MRYAIRVPASTVGPPAGSCDLAYAVKVLRDAGIETTESCEGGDGHAFPEPTIRFNGQRGEGFKAVACALAHGLPVSELRRTWPIIDGEPTGPLWELTFVSRDVLMKARRASGSGGIDSVKASWGRLR